MKRFDEVFLLAKETKKTRDQNLPKKGECAKFGLIYDVFGYADDCNKKGEDFHLIVLSIISSQDFNPDDTRTVKH